MSTTATRLRDKVLGTASPYETHATQALGIYRALHAAAKHGDARDNKLSAKAYLAEALRNGKTTPEKLRKLEALLAQEPDGHPLLDQFLAAVQRGATALDGSANLRPVVGNLHVVMRASQQEFTSLLVEAMEHGTTALELVALAVLRATERQPERFGVIADWDGHHESIEQQRAQLGRLYAQVADAALAERAVKFHHAQGDLWRLTFMWRGEDSGAGFSPDGAAGERLVAWLAAQQ